MTTNPFISTWHLRAACALTDDRQRIPSPLGDKVLGQIMYDAGGNMSAQLMADAPRPRWRKAGADARMGTGFSTRAARA